MRLEVYSGCLSRLRTEILALACFKDIRPLRGLAGEVDWYYSGIISRMMMHKRFTGFHGETLLTPTEGKLRISKVMMIGLGPSSSYDALQFENAVVKLVKRIAGLQVRDCAVATDSFCGEALEISWVAASFLKAWHENPSAPALNLVINDLEQAKAFQRKIKGGAVYSDTPESAASEHRKP